MSIFDDMFKVFEETTKGLSDIYSSVMSYYLPQNIEDVTLQNNKKIEQQLKKYGKTKFILPKVTDMIKDENILKKYFENRGRLLKDSLKEQLQQNIKDVLSETTVITGEELTIRRRGKLAGTIQPEIIKQLEEKFKTTFEDYTKVDKTLGMPKNIHAIAVTEIRSTLNKGKDDYVTELLKQNDNYAVFKKWIHNPHLSKIPRRSHIRLGRKKAIPKENNFVFKNDNGIMTSMRYPHDENVSIDNFINCNCDCEYMIQVLVKDIKE